jgi:hypothetical protein
MASQEIAVKNKAVAVANKIIMSRYRLTDIECRLVFHLIGLINKDDSDFAEYRYTTKELLQAIGMTANNVVQLKDTMDSVFAKSLIIETDTGWIKYHWFDVAEYITLEKVYRIRFNDELKPFLLQLVQQFTLLDFQAIMRMTVHSRRIYMLAKKDEWQHRNKKISIQELKTMLDISDKYTRFQNFRNRVLEPAEKEINEFSDISLIITPDETTRKGRAYRDLIFRARLKPKHKLGNAAPLALAPPKPESKNNENLREQRLKLGKRLDELLDKRWAALKKEEQAEYISMAEATARGLEDMYGIKQNVKTLAVGELGKELEKTDKEYSALAARYTALELIA